MPDIDKNVVLRDVLSSLNEEVPPMPENLHGAWMQKVEEDMKNQQAPKFHMPKTVTRWLSTAAALVFIIGGTLLTRDDLAPASGASMNQKSAVYSTRTASYDDYAVEESAEYEYGAANGVMLTMARGADAAAAPVVAEKKIIRTASMTIATQTFEDSLNALKSACEGQNGWIESSSENVNNATGLRTAYLTLRIPQSALDAYIAGTEGLGRITSRSESAQDVTESYQDTAARLETQKALMARLQALITESADLSDLLELESQIADTQYQIDSYESSQRSIDSRVDMSHVDLTLVEETSASTAVSDVTMGERLAAALKASMEWLGEFARNVLVFVVMILPVAAPLAVIVIVWRLIARRRKNKEG